MTEIFPNKQPIWCAGCGHFGVLAALDDSFDRLKLPRHEALVLAGIGCSGTVQNHLPSYGYHALHGRVVPSAIGAKLANPELTVVAAGGDGDGFAIGGGHLLHAFRTNANITYVVMNNETYGLTKGQPSPTNGGGYQNQREMDAIMLGLSLPGSTFLARGYSGAPAQLAELMDAAINHARAGQGFAFLEVISPCVTYNDNYHEWPSTLVNVDDDKAYDPSDRAAALAMNMQLDAEGRVPSGLIYRAPATLREAVSDPPPAPLDGMDLDKYASQYERVMDAFVG
jgi:2-oxoglutarate ferredoxin oxidoreductase subunit beta